MKPQIFRLNPIIFVASISLIVLFNRAPCYGGTLTYVSDSMTNRVTGATPVTHVITLRVSDTGTINTVTMQFSPGFNLTGVTLGNTSGIGAGTINVAGDTVIYTVTAPDTINAGTVIKVTLNNIINASLVANTYTVTVSTISDTGAIIDGPTPTPNFVLSDHSTFNPSSSYITFLPYYIKADGTSACTAVVTINDLSGYPISGKSVTLASARGNSDTIGPSNPQTTDSSGVCTFTIISNYSGWDTITARCDGNTITMGVNKDGAVGIWHFDTDTLDYSGYGNNGIACNGPVWVTGKSGSALQFDGIDDYVEVLSSSSLNPTDAVTIEVWINERDNPNWRKTIRKPNQYTIGLGGGDDFYFQIGDGSSDQGVGYGAGTGGISHNAWHHMVFLYDYKAQRAEGWIDGVLIGTNWTGSWSPIGTTGNSLIIGGADPSSTFNATLDEVRIYNRALSADEIKASYNKRANIYFTGNKLKITTPAITTTVNNPSSYIRVEVQDGMGIRDTSFNNTVTLSSSSSGGKFSVARVNWTDTTIITLSSGYATIYYKDSSMGNPVLTVSRSGYTSDTQVEIILAQGVNETASFVIFTPYQILADGTSVCSVVISINDTYGFPIVNKLTTLQTTNGNSDTIQDSLGGTVNPQTTDANGQCTFTIKSNYFGWDTITARCDGNTVARGVNKYGAVGIWHFDTDTKDVSGYGNNGVLYGALWTSAPDSAAQGSALQFDGINDYVNCGDNGSLDFGPGQDFSVELWFKGNPSHTMQGLISKGDGFSSDQWDIRDGWDASQVLFRNNNDKLLSAGGGWFDQQWHHCVVTIDRDNTSCIYMDGTLRGSLASSNWGTFENNVDLNIGRRSVGPEYFDGIIDEVHIYNRTLSETEVKASYLARANIYFIFAATKLKTTTSPFTVTLNNPSPAIVVQAQDNLGNKDTTFNGTVTLSSSSGGGYFSVARGDWANTNVVTLVQGEITVYYKDSNTGNPVITAYRAGLITDTQVESIIPPSIDETVSYLSAKFFAVNATGIDSITIAVTINDTYRYPIAGKSVTLSTSRGNSDALSANPQTTDSNGQCTFTISSLYSGNDTIAAICEGKTISNLFGDNFSCYSDGDTGYPVWNPISGTWRVENGEYSANVPQANQTAIFSFVGSNSWTNYIVETKFRLVNVDSSNAQLGIRFRNPDIMNGWVYRINNYNGANGYASIAGYLNITTDPNINPSTQTSYYGNNFNNIFNWSDTATVHSLKVIVQDDTMYAYVDDTLTNIANDNRYLTGMVGLYSYLCHVHFDNLKVYPLKVKFNPVPVKLKITSPARTSGSGTPSESITVEVWDNSNNRVTSFNDTVTLKSSSLNGRFSQDRLNWSTTNDSSITLVSGYNYFYYRDTTIGSPTITVSRSALQSDTQTENIVQSYPSETNSYFTVIPTTIPADAVFTCNVVISIRDASSTPIQGKQVTISTSRGPSQNVITQPGVTDSTGQCTGMVASGYTGGDTIFVSCDDKTIVRHFYSGLVLGYIFEETGTTTVNNVAGDSSGTIYGGAVWTTGKFGSGLQFNGVNGYVDIQNSYGTRFDSQTICLWIKPGSNSNAEIIRKGDEWGITTGSGGSIVILRHYLIDTPNHWWSLSAKFNLNEWNFICVIWQRNPDSTFAVKVFVNGVWEQTSGTIDTSYTDAAQVKLGTGYTGNFLNGTIDELRIYSRALTTDEVNALYQSKANIYFKASKLNFTSPAFKIKAGSSSPITEIAAGGLSGGIDTTFTGTATLASNSESRSFSLDGNNWGTIGSDTIVSLTNGYGYFYYKDYKTGDSIITVSRQDLGLQSGTRTVMIRASSMVITSPVFTISTTDSAFLRAIAYDYSGNTDTIFNETAALSSSSGGGRFSISNTTWQDTTVIKFSNGSTIFYHRDKRGGNPIITILHPELVLSATQVESIIMPVIIVSKQMKNERSGVSGTLVSAAADDTVEYTITIKNNGTETATNIIITDTDAFDTNNYSPLTFVSMDTADTYAYTTDPSGINWISGMPAVSDQEKIKGLRWKVNTLIPAEEKQLKFRVKIK